MSKPFSVRSYSEGFGLGSYLNVDEEEGAAAADDLMARFGGSGGGSRSPKTLNPGLSSSERNSVFEASDMNNQGTKLMCRDFKKDKGPSSHRRGSQRSSAGTSGRSSSCSRLQRVSFNESQDESSSEITWHQSEGSSVQPPIKTLRRTPLSIIDSEPNEIEFEQFEIDQHKALTRSLSNQTPVTAADISRVPQDPSSQRSMTHPAEINDTLQGNISVPRPPKWTSHRSLSFKLLRFSCMLSSTCTFD